MAVTLSLMAAPAFAVSLEDARAQGLVGEKPDGLIAAVKPSPDVNTLVESVNAKRVKVYKDLAAQNGQPLDAAEAVAGEKLIGKLKPGQYYMKDDGSWTKK